ncbi:hypothetical protein QBC38DRAFT_120470 [Podospora fimiseda]|uniref:Uncharacterized protein n=1 Tax=Podospora fimiseda TaxID=252190 RepID=A0AAN7BTH1_9PEZI|nr:hypothetical protein QBC38DRAFT_120470 [Podospora fimiseda]
MSRLPFLEVEHLPSSTTFYSAVLQPLDLYFLGSERGHFPVSTYGHSSGEPILQLHQVVASRDRPLKRSRIVLSAPSEAATDEAFKFAKRANPDLQDEHLRHPDEAYPATSGVTAHRRIIAGGGLHVFISDFDDNNMEIVYQPPPQYPSHYTGSTVRQTRSTSDEASRILTWNFDVAGSSAPSPVGPGTAYSGPARALVPRQPAGYLEYDEEETQPAHRRSLTTSNSTYEPAASARENSNGLSAGAVVGTLLGVAAAGAAALTTYNMVKSDRRAPYLGDYDSPPSFSRRSTFGEKYDPYSDRKGRYGDLDYSADRPRYSEDYPSTSDYRRPPPDYIARYSQVDSHSKSRGFDNDFFDDSRGRHSSTRSRSSLRPRSEAANDREPYMMDTEQRAWPSSKPARHPPIVQRSYTYDTPERDTYVSSRTVRAPPPDPYSVPPLSRSGSRVTTTYKVTGGARTYGRDDSYGSSRYPAIPDSRPPAYLSRGYSDMPSSRSGGYYASRQPLPRSASGGHATWEPEDDDDDDADSIAPSDSISCVGSRRSR